MTINDGTTVFKTRDKREIALFDLLYPVGIIVSTTSTTAPFSVGTWEEVGKGRVLQGCGTGQTAGNTVEAGLPAITGSTILDGQNPENIGSGAIKFEPRASTYKSSYNTGGKMVWGTLSIDASRSSPIYGASTTVQPPAYLVHFWRRLK